MSRTPLVFQSVEELSWLDEESRPNLTTVLSEALTLGVTRVIFYHMKREFHLVDRSNMKRTVIAAVAALSLTMSACGSDSSNASKNESSGPTAQAVAEAKAAGEKAAKSAGDPVDLTVGKVALLQVSGVSESSQRIEDAFRAAAKVVNISDIAYCDAQGDASKMGTCFNTLLAQKPKVIFLLSTEPSAVSGGLARAKAAGVPVIGFGGATGVSEDEAPEELAGSYFTDDRVASKQLSDYMVKDLGGKGKIGLFTYPPLLALKARSDVLEDELKGTDIKVVESHVTDFANPIEDVRKATVAMLTSHPDLDAIWFATDFNGPAIQQGIAQANPSKKPKVYGFRGNPSNIAAIKAGAINAVPDDFVEWNSWVAIDQAVELVARGKAPSRDPRPDYELKDFMRSIMLDADNVPADGKVVPNPVDYVTFFTTKWRTEFSNLK